MLDNFKFKTAKEYNQLLADRDTIKQQLEASQAEVATLKTASVEQTEKVNGFAKVEDDYKKQIEELKATHSKEQTTLQAQAEAEKNSAEVKAQAIVASMGVSPDAKLPQVTEAIPTSTVLDQWAKASEKDKRDIFKNNKAEILKMSGISIEQWEAVHGK